MKKGLKVYNTKPKMKLIPLAIAGLLLVTTPVGCIKKMDCSRTDSHAHKYINNQGLVEYVESENEIDGAFSDFRWTSEAVKLTNDIKLEDKLDLLSINDNKEVLSQLMMNNRDYIEFEYKYEWTEEIKHYKTVTDEDGNTTQEYDYSTYVHHTDYYYTTDVNHIDLTGNARNVTYMYKAYKLTRNSKGEFNIKSSELTDNIFNVAAQYPYIKANDFCTTVTGNKYTLDNGYSYSK